MQLTGFILDESLNPISGAAVDVYAAVDGPAPTSSLASTTTDADGRWNFAGLTDALKDVKVVKSSKGYWVRGSTRANIAALNVFGGLTDSSFFRLFHGTSGSRVTVNASNVAGMTFRPFATSAGTQGPSANHYRAIELVLDYAGNGVADLIATTLTYSGGGDGVSPPGEVGILIGGIESTGSGSSFGIHTSIHTTADPNTATQGARERAGTFEIIRDVAIGTNGFSRGVEISSTGTVVAGEGIYLGGAAGWTTYIYLNSKIDSLLGTAAGSEVKWLLAEGSDTGSNGGFRILHRRHTLGTGANTTSVRLQRMSDANIHHYIDFVGLATPEFRVGFNATDLLTLNSTGTAFVVGASAATQVTTLGGASSTNSRLDVVARGASGVAHLNLGVAGDDADFASRLIREPGANGSLLLVNKGTGNIVLRPNNSSAVDLTLASTGALTVAAGGLTVTGASTFNDQLNSTLGSITADEPNFNGTVTWTNAGVTFTAIKLTIVDTASDAASKLIDIIVGPATQFSVTKAGVVNALGAYQIDATQVVSNRVTGWTAATGSATRTTFATTTVTTEQLAERVKALIDDLITHGLIGT